MKEAFIAPETVHRKKEWSIVRAMLELGRKYRINLTEFPKFDMVDIGRSFACAFGEDGDILYRLLSAMPLERHYEWFFTEEFQGFETCTKHRDYNVPISQFFYWMKRVGIYQHEHMVCYKNIDYVLLPFGSDT